MSNHHAFESCRPAFARGRGSKLRRGKPEARSEAGYTIIELLISVGILMVVSAGVFTGVQQLTTVGETVNNRSEMHAGVRNATELLQQEVGQAGSIALPAPVTLTVAALIGAGTATVSSVTGMFVGEKLIVGAGANAETITVTGINVPGNTLTLDTAFANAHVAGDAVIAQGGFSAGVIPTTTLNGSTATVLKMFGDVNNDGNMVYVEYTCDVAAGNLYRNSMAFDAAAKALPNVSQVLLNNVQPNPGGTPCFTYQERTVTGTTFVTDVAITLTVQTQRRDPLTGLFQMETKALLNVSPRNVFQVWQMATMNVTSRVQPTPPSVTALLPPL